MSTDDSSTDLDHVDEAVRALLPNYLKRRSVDVVTINELLQTGDFLELGRLAHNMRGSGGAYGLPKITEIGGQMEAAAKQQDGEKIAELVQTLEHFLSGIRL
ncbi:MAG: Hpt domain-containing protein [Gammaproteobacteria bacterium]|nr:Hpt domain-containing protein [Gammaproteobacteria bacterium]